MWKGRNTVHLLWKNISVASTFYITPLPKNSWESIHNNLLSKCIPFCFYFLFMRTMWSKYSLSLLYRWRYMQCVGGKNQGDGYTDLSRLPFHFNAAKDTMRMETDCIMSILYSISKNQSIMKSRSCKDLCISALPPFLPISLYPFLYPLLPFLFLSILPFLLSLSLLS